MGSCNTKTTKMSSRPDIVVGKLETDTADVVVGKVLVDEQESLVLPEQYAAIKNIIDENMADLFENYLRTRKTITNRDLRTRELKLLFDNRAFVCALAYLKHFSDVECPCADFSVALSTRHPAQKIPATNLAAVYAVQNEHILHVLRQRDATVDLFRRYSDRHSFFAYVSYADGIAFVQMLEDPFVPYERLEQWLRCVQPFSELLRPKDILNGLLRLGAYRAARFYALYACGRPLLNSNSMMRGMDTVVAPYLDRLLTVKPFVVPVPWLIAAMCNAQLNADLINLFVNGSDDTVTRIVSCVDFNVESPNMDMFMQKIPEDLYKIALARVWRLPRRQYYEKIRPIA